MLCSVSLICFIVHWLAITPLDARAGLQWGPVRDLSDLPSTVRRGTVCGECKSDADKEVPFELVEGRAGPSDFEDGQGC